MGEQWRDIQGFEGIYQVSALGRIKSLKMKGSLNGRIRKPGKHKSGYLTVNLFRCGKAKYYSIHRLVVAAFLTDYSINKGVDHINGVTDDNKVSNLRMATFAENSANSKRREGVSSKYKGVYWNKKNKKWVCQVTQQRKQMYIGSFTGETEAAKAYDKKAVELFGEFAKTNKEMGGY